MKYILAAALLLSAPAMAAVDLDSLPNNSWVLVDRDGIQTTAAGTGGNTGILAFSGMAYDSANQQLLVFGGGHCDYAGNEVWAFSTSTQTWTEMYPPTAFYPASLCPGGFDNVNYPGAVFDPPGEPIANAQPLTKHTYDTVEWLAAANRMFVTGTYTYAEGVSPCAGPTPCYLWGPQDTWLFNPSTLAWDYKNVARATQPNGIAGAAYDPVSGLMYVLAREEIWTYNHATDAWTKLSPSGGPPPASLEFAAEYDSARRVIYRFGGNFPFNNELWKYDIVGNSWTQLTPGGATPPSTIGAGLAYDSVNDVLVAFCQPLGTWVYDPSANTWADMNPSPDAPAEGPVYGRLKYDPVNNVVWLVVKPAPFSPTVETWAYKYAGQSVPLAIDEPVGVNRTGEPVTTGVPLPPGTQRATWSLWDGATEIPVQVTPLVGNANWMLVDFQISLAATGSKSLELRQTASVATHATPIQKTETATQIDLDTGPLEVVIKKDFFNLFQSVSLSGTPLYTASGSQVTLTDHASTVFNANTVAPDSVVWEYDGPLRKTLRVDGDFSGWPGMGYTVRITLYAGSTTARIEYVIRNSLQANQRHIHMDSARLKFGAAGTLYRSTASGSMIAQGYPGGGMAYDLVTAADDTGNGGTVVPDWSYYGATVLVDFSNPGTTEMTRQLDAAKSPLMALAPVSWFSDYGDLTLPQFGTLEDEQQVYTDEPLTWNPGDVPSDAPAPDYKVGWEQVDVHGDSENDDLWQNILMYLRIPSSFGYYHRARAWSRYYKWEYPFRTDGFEYAWDGNFEPPPGVSRPDISTGLTATDLSYISSNYNTGKQDVNLSNDFGGDHTFGFGLADWYHLTGDPTALNALTDIAEAAYRCASTFTPGVSTASFELRLWSRWLLTLQRQYEMQSDSTWDARRTHAADLLRLSTAWDATWGMYHKNLVEAGCSYTNNHYVSPFQLIWCSWAHYRYFLDTGATWASDRLVSMANFVKTYGINPVTGLAGHKMWIDCDAPGDVYYETQNAGYTITLADVLTIGYRLDGDGAKVTKAKTAWLDGMCGVYPSSPGVVCRFVNQEIIGGNVWYRHNGYLHSTNLSMRELAAGAGAGTPCATAPGL